MVVGSRIHSGRIIVIRIGEMEKRVTSTHSYIGIKFPDGTISGCYVHYDGTEMGPRIRDYLDMHTMTNLVILIGEAQKVGGIRSFHEYNVDCSIEDEDEELEKITQLFEDPDPYIIDEATWEESRATGEYYYLIDYETGDITSD